jgi:hypothetical protein
VSRDSTRAYYYIINLITHFVAIRAQIVQHSQGSDKRSEERGGTAGGECLGLLLVSSDAGQTRASEYFRILEHFHVDISVVGLT